jgi:hypothetical protein
MKKISAVGAIIFLVTFHTLADTTSGLSAAEMQGRRLVQTILEHQPGATLTNSGVFKIRDGKGARWEIPIECQTIVTATNWQNIYTASWTNKVETLWVVHGANQPNAYAHDTDYLAGGIPRTGLSFRGPRQLSDGELMTPFANSDFWVADLGLEFFHWPEQKILPNTTTLKLGRSYLLLESTNPNPAPKGYARVRSWIDKETDGILEAEAYDAAGNKLKSFFPKAFKQDQLESMEMDNDQTGSRTRLEFDLSAK